MTSNKPGTKSQIFNTALRLFAINGYENVSIRAIADAVGIKAASIYYHYSSKEEILKDCYRFFTEHRYSTRLEQTEYAPIMQCGTPREVLDILNYSFPDEILQNMIFCLFIIYARIYNDENAKGVLIDDINSSMGYLIDFFNFGIKTGRFFQFNVPSVSLIVLSARMFMAQSITLNLERTNDWLNVGKENFEELTKIIPFKY